MVENNILVIEDNKEDAALLQEVIQSAGYKVWVCTDSKDGLRLLKSMSFTVVLTELHMAGMSGEDITREALKINSRISVLVLTSNAFLDSAIEVMEQGAYGYVNKPFHSAEIKIVLQRAVEKFHLLSASRKKQRYAEMSVTDGLTGVYNRRFLDVFLNEKISEKRFSDEHFSLLMIDLDHFKKYNDTHGHQAGDELLVEVCKVFQKSIRRDDVVFRYGGEEFMVYLESSNKKFSCMVAERILDAVTLCLPATVSIGVGTFPYDSEDQELLIKKVDAALYEAKETGRNKFCAVETGN